MTRSARCRVSSGIRTPRSPANLSLTESWRPVITSNGVTAGFAPFEDCVDDDGHARIAIGEGCAEGHDPAGRRRTTPEGHGETGSRCSIAATRSGRADMTRARTYRMTSASMTTPTDAPISAARKLLVA